MQTIEAKRAVQEVCRAFARASDTAKLDHIFRNDIGFVAGRNDLVGNGVVSAPLAKSGGVATIVRFFKAGQIKFYICKKF